MDTQGFEAATQQLKLTPQEQALYQRHLMNLYGPGKVAHPDGSISTLYQINVSGPKGQFYNVPTVYDGRILQPEEAIQRAKQIGFEMFPSYPTREAADARYDQMHSYMDQDVGRYLAQQSKLNFSGQR